MADSARLERPTAFCENLIQSAADGVIAASKTGKILIFNKAAAEIFGYEVEEALETLDIRDIYPDDGARQTMKMLRSAEYGGKGKLRSYLVDIRRKNGQLVPIELNAAIVYEDGEEVATIGFFHDLRETLKIRQELDETQVQLLQAEKLSSLGKLAAGVAHQLNNPLGGIVIYAGILLEEYDLIEKAREDLTRILRDARRCHSIVKELLEFARPPDHEKTLNDMNKAVGRTLFLLQSQPMFHNIEIVEKFADDLPLVPGNRQQLNHLLMNLVLNAVEAMEGRGRLTVETGVIVARKCVYVSIADTGPGVPDSVIERVFEPFFTTKKDGKGTGLGLSLAYSIVQDHGGRIFVDNQKSGGAIFTVELPLPSELQVQDGVEGHG